MYFHVSALASRPYAVRPEELRTAAAALCAPHAAHVRSRGVTGSEVEPFCGCSLKLEDIPNVECTPSPTSWGSFRRRLGG